MICEILCVLSSISIGLMMIFFHSMCPFETTAKLTIESTILGSLSATTYSLTLTSVNAIFAYRVYLSFSDTIYSLSDKLIKLLMGLFISLYIIDCGLPIMFIFDVKVAVASMTLIHVKHNLFIYFFYFFFGFAFYT